MALVTLQRSPSPSNDPDEESGEGGEDGVDGRAALHRKSLSESYFTVKGAALILPHNDLNRKTSRKNHGGEIQRHLQSMLYLLRPEDKIKVAIRLESQRDNEHRYMALVSTTGRQDTEESVILGMDCSTTSTFSATATTPPASPTSTAAGAAAAGGPFEGKSSHHTLGPHHPMATIGLVLPMWMGMKVRLNGDGGFTISLDDKSYLFKPVSVQAMWSAIQSLDKALHQAEHMKYLAEGLTHTWVEYYRSKVDSTSPTQLAKWNLMEDVEIFAPASLSFTNENESEKLKLTISAKLKEVMMSVDLDEATSRSLRQQVEQALNMKLDQFRSYFDEELFRILGQMDAPSQIVDFLYLGSEWNASNLEELQQLGIKYILNVTREIDNFFTGMFHYCNVRLYDKEDSELMKHWLKTYKFINKARKHGSKVLVHCKMGISRSASTVMAFLMKENRWSLDKAFNFVKERRNCVRPNKGFMEQLRTYEGILNASNKRDIFRSRSEQDMLDSGEGEAGEGVQQGTFLGDSLFRVMSDSDWPSHTLTPEEEILLSKNCGGDHNYTGMEPDLETDSRSADSMEESLPDMPSPLSEKPAVFVLPPQGPAPLATAEESDLPPKPGHNLLPGDGAPSRIKPDSSWIKLEDPGESTTDPVPEGMDVGEIESDALEDSEKDTELNEPEVESPAPVFVMGSEADSEAAQASNGVEEVRNTESFDETGTETADQPESDFDMGVHQYYNREQIPWNPGTVRNLREEFCGAGQNVVSAVSDLSVKPAPAPHEEEVPLESEETPQAAAEGVEETPMEVRQCETCEEAPGLGQEGVDAEGMEDDDDRSKSVYELEDIPLTPGTVQRTRQEIEERQKLYGEDCDHSIYGMRSVKRSSSLREERERDSSRNRDSERRKTCTPIVSPPPEKASETTEPEEVVSIEAAVLKLDFEVEESTTDDVEMVEKEEGEEEEEEEKDVAVYTYGEECVPVEVGIVRRHKQEIESKSGESSKSHQRCLSSGSNGSLSSGEDVETTGHWSPPHDGHSPPITSLSENSALTDRSETGLGHTQHIPASEQQQSPSVQPSYSAAYSVFEKPVPKQSDPHTETKSEAEGAFAPVAFSVGSGKSDNGTQQHFTPSGGGRGPLADSAVVGSYMDTKTTGNSSQVSPRSRYSSEGSALEDSSAETSKSESAPLFRPYSHSFPSAKKQVGKSNFDAETLAMIREIGSAFVTSPTRTEEEESSGDSTSLVKHLVKNIEKEIKVPKQERKIVIIDSSSGQSKRPGRGESGSSLFTPSPEFTSAITKQLFDSSEQSSLSQNPFSFSSAGQGMEESRSVVGGCAEGSHNPVFQGSLGDGEKGKDERPMSVVKHLLGRFESHSPYMEKSEEEQSLSGTLDSSSAACALQSAPTSLPCGNNPVIRREKSQPSFQATITKSRSLEEQPMSDTPESLSLTGQVGATPAGFNLPHTSQHSRRPRSAEHVPYHYTPGIRQGAHSPRVRPPWDRELGSGREEEGGSEGIKVRRLHGKSHPLFRLQQQRQEDSPYPPTIQRHSPFHSTM